MAIAYKSAGAGVSTETSGAALSPAWPATVDANDIGILFTAWEGTTSAPSPPGDWTLLGASPYNVGSAATVARAWVYGKIAAGTEDGATVALGSPAVTTQRAARIYTFSGLSSGTITQLVPSASFSTLVGDTDPTGPTVDTTIAGSLACAWVYQNDNNTLETFAGSSDTWTERGTVGGYIFALTPGGVLDLLTATPAADPGTVSGGAMTVTNDPWVVIGCEIRPSVPVVTKTDTETGTLTDTGAVATSGTDTGTLAETGQAVETASVAGTETGTLAETGAPALATSDTGTLYSGLEVTVGETTPYGATLGDSGVLSQPVADAEALTLATESPAIALGIGESLTVSEAVTGSATTGDTDTGAAVELAGIGVEGAETGVASEGALVPAALVDSDAESVTDTSDVDTGGTSPTDTEDGTLSEAGAVQETVVGVAGPVADTRGFAMIGPQRPHRKRPKTQAELDAEEAAERRRRQRAVEELLLTVLADV